MKYDDSVIEILEEAMDKMEEDLPPLKYFVFTGRSSMY